MTTNDVGRGEWAAHCADDAEAQAEADSKPHAATAMPSKRARASMLPGLRHPSRSWTSSGAGGYSRSKSPEASSTHGHVYMSLAIRSVITVKANSEVFGVVIR